MFRGAVFNSFNSDVLRLALESQGTDDLLELDWFLQDA